MKENDFLYDIFTCDYGIIKTNKKASKTNTKPLDVGYIINFEIITSKSYDIHKMANIKILSEFICEHKNFEEIHHYLSLLKTISKHIPL
jgi:hypothetical protein